MTTAPITPTPPPDTPPPIADAGSPLPATGTAPDPEPEALISAATPTAAPTLAPPPAAPLTLHMPVDVRNLSLALLALFATVALLHWASAVFIPIMLSLLLTTALRPAVDILHRWHIPRWLGAGALLIAMVSGLASAAWSLSDGAAQLVDSLPVAATKVRDNLKIGRAHV